MPVWSSFVRLTFAPLFVVGVLLAVAAPAAAQPVKPDLRVSVLGAPPATSLPGDSFLVSPTVVNQGAATAGPSTTPTYAVQACADTASAVAEQAEDNNCATSAGTRRVQ